MNSYVYRIAFEIRTSSIVPMKFVAPPPADPIVKPPSCGWPCWVLNMATWADASLPSTKMLRDSPSRTPTTCMGLVAPGGTRAETPRARHLVILKCEVGRGRRAAKAIVLLIKTQLPRHRHRRWQQSFHDFCGTPLGRTQASRVSGRSRHRPAWESVRGRSAR